MIKILGAILIAVTLTPVIMCVMIKSITPFVKQWDETVKSMKGK